MSSGMFKMPAAAKNIIDSLEGAGFEAYAVGGCVRDALLSRTPGDWDFCTNAKPEDVVALFENVLTFGIKHGTVTVLINDTPYEVTSWRTDGEYADMRHPKQVTLGVSLLDDLSRRDFTINSMTYNPNKGVYDPFGGIDDLLDKLIKCVGNPEKRFNEDALRILRAIRFASVLEFTIHKDTAHAIHLLAPSLNHISMERIRAELVKLILGDGAQNILEEYADVLLAVIPELGEGYIDKLRQGQIFNAISIAPKNIEIRLALLFSCLEGDNTSLEPMLRRLKLKTQEVKRIMEILGDRGKLLLGKDGAKVWLRRFGYDRLTRIIDFECAISAVKNFDVVIELEKMRSQVVAIVKNEECYSLSKLAISGDDLKTIGIPSGIGINKTLNALLDMVIKGDVPNQRKPLAAAVRRLQQSGFIAP